MTESQSQCCPELTRAAGSALPKERKYQRPPTVSSGSVFGSLIVISNAERAIFFSSSRPHGRRRQVVAVRCSLCNAEKKMLVQNLHVNSKCDCQVVASLIAANTKHGESRSRLYKIWHGMLSRCYYQGTSHFYDYGGRGISVCDAWHQYEPFRDWMNANGWHSGLEIDRKDNDGNYSPDNCRLVTHKINNRNKRDTRILTAFGESKSVADWAEDHRCTVIEGTLRSRLIQGWTDHEKIISTPPLIVRERKEAS